MERRGTAVEVNESGWVTEVTLKLSYRSAHNMTNKEGKKKIIVISRTREIHGRHAFFLERIRAL